MWTLSKKKCPIKDNGKMHFHFKGDKFVFLNSKVSWGGFPTTSASHWQEVTHLTQLSIKKTDHESAWVAEKKAFWDLRMKSAMAQK